MIRQRKCVGCGELKSIEELIKITKDYQSGKVVVNPNSKTFGRSAYLCYNSTCKELALKKNKLARALKTSADLKGIIDNTVFCQAINNNVR